MEAKHFRDINTYEVYDLLRVTNFFIEDTTSDDLVSKAVSEYLQECMEKFMWIKFVLIIMYIITF